MTGHSWIGMAIALGALGLAIALFLFASPLFAIIIVVALLLLSPLLFGARRVAGVDPETPSHEDVTDPHAPADASPRAPHGYTPSS
jgi:hypothetical protein